MEDFKYIACAPPHCNCPVLDVEDDTVYITDDYGMVVQLTVDQMGLLALAWIKIMERDGDLPDYVHLR